MCFKNDSTYNWQPQKIFGSFTIRLHVFYQIWTRKGWGKVKVCMEPKIPVEMFPICLIKHNKIVGCLNKNKTAKFVKDHFWKENFSCFLVVVTGKMLILEMISTVWIESKFWVFSGLYFTTFQLKMEIYCFNVRIQFKCEKIQTRKNCRFGHFLRSELEVRSLWLTSKVNECLALDSIPSRHQNIFAAMNKKIG